MDDKIPDYVDEQLAKDHFFTQSHGLTICDCMMNLPLLFWAGAETGHPVYGDVAREQIETTLKYFFREDDSIYHAYRFDDEGHPLGGENFCGFRADSAWARGTSWLIYGLAIAYRYAGEKRYLDTSLRLFKKYALDCDETGVGF